jgi:hypothetical protein
MIARVFPHRTNATPDDPLAFVGMPDLLTPEWFDEVHISVTFTYDLPLVDKLIEGWIMRTDRISLGGPATGMRGEQFIPGVYLKKGYVITSRGCPNNCLNCWFCTVHEREGDIRELEIQEGWNLLDSNILACSENHIKNVFSMLEYSKHKYHHPIEFTGGLEARRLQDWHVNWLKILHPKQLFCAYDTEDDYDPLCQAGLMLDKAGIPFNSRRAYVLCGFHGDTKDKAENRMLKTIKAGFIPMAMLYRDENGIYNKDWTKFQKEWTRPAIMRAKGLIKDKTRGL